MDMDGRISVELFVTKSLGLIEKERNTELEETRLLQEQVPLKELQRRGVCLLKLHLSSHYTGLYGRTVLVFTPFWEGKDLPSHRFTPGDIAGIQISQGASNPTDLITSAIVSRVTSNSLHVACEESFDQLEIDDQTPYKLLKLANDITYKRMKKCLEELRNYQGSDGRHLVSVLFGELEPGPSLNKARDGVEHDCILFNPNLDESQQEAVRFALGQREVAIIHGPPGTGKTTTVTEIILQEVKRGNKLLVCAPSNIAVDNLVEKLSHYKPRMVRIGHPARVLASIQKFSLDAILSNSDETQLVKDVRSDIDQSLSRLKKTRDKGARQRLREELKHLRKELRVREAKAIKEILQRCDVVLCTLTMANSNGPLKHLEKKLFDLVVIDECSQSMEVACWIALQKGNRCMLAGDHNQLPPTIISHQAAKEGLAFTLMERLLKLYGDVVMRMLTTQYRMHEDIMRWPSDQLYHGKLTAHESVAKHLLKDVPGVEETEVTAIPVLLIDTSGCDLQELTLCGEVSKGNEGEADIVTSHVEHLINSGLPAKDIAVIAPYNLQVELLRVRLSQKYPGLEIKSVDGFQGREKEAVVISLVRSNDKGQVGFLAEDRRINVAITRARRHLAVICDSDTISHHKFLKDMVDYLTDHGEVRSAQQYIQAGVLDNDYKRPEHLNDLLNHQRSDVKQGTQNIRAKQNQQENSMNRNNQAKQKPQAQNTCTSKTHRGVDKVEQALPVENASCSEWTNDRIQKHIANLMANDTQQSYSFPPALNGNERKIVHEICENLGLVHISVGIGRSRHIVISKQTDNKKEDETQTPSSACEVQDQSKPSSSTQDHTPVVREGKHTADVKTSKQDQLGQDADFKICDKCRKNIPCANFELHALRCSGPQVPAKPDATSVRPKQKKPKSAKKKSATKLENTADVEDDFDALIADAIKQNTTCFFPKCKNNAATLGTNCKFCVKRFCLAHHIAEAHGCGDAARTHARATVRREGVLYRGSGVPDKKPDPTKRAHLERKLNKKLDQMSDKRKHKNKDP